MMTDEDRAEIRHRKQLEDKCLEHAVEWCRIGCKVGAADGFLIVTFCQGELFTAASDAALNADKTNRMIDKLLANLGKFFGIELTPVTIRVADGEMIQ